MRSLRRKHTMGSPGQAIRRRCPEKRPAARLAVLLGLMLALFSIWAPVALAQGTQINYTLEACRASSTFILPSSPPFVCPDGDYTTGNLGKNWAELDLVPHRVTLRNDDDTQTYSFVVAGDYVNNAETAVGWDVITDLVKNAAHSDPSCPDAATAGQIITPDGAGAGGAYKTIYRQVTLTQQAGTTCVYDYLQRLALGAHLFSGSSLQSNLWNPDLGSQGIGQKRLSIPVNEIQPQELHKDMTASQNVDFPWNITKEATPATLDLGNTCLPENRQKGVTLTITWQRLEGVPGAVNVATNIYATNPAHRTIRVNVCDDIRAGETSLNTGCAIVDVPANTTQLVLTHTFAAPADSQELNDIATATYTDVITGQPVPGQTTATAAADIQQGDQTNETASIRDAEAITGTGLDFSLDSINPTTATWTCDSSLPSPFTTGIYACNSGIQTGGGNATFNKTVRLDQARNTSGVLADRALLTGADGYTARASALINITTAAKVTLTINKTMPDILQAGETVAFNFEVRGPAPSTALVASPSITFSAGQTSQSVAVGNLDPGVYQVTELSTQGFETVSANPQTVDISLPSERAQACQGEVSFENRIASFAKVEVRKATDPAGYEAGWTFHLSNGAQATTTGPGFIELANNLPEGSYTVSEDLLDGWQFVSADCTRNGVPVGTTFSVNYPDDFGVTYQCTFNNMSRGAARVVKTVQGLAPTGSQSFTFQLRQGASSIQTGTILESGAANSANGGLINFGYLLVPTMTYALCEQVMPGWMTTLGPPFYVVYNPSGDNSIVCTDFTVSPGETRVFSIDNTPPPGGLARTIGFWKNWASCSSSKGKQDPVLDQTLGVGDITIGTLVLHDGNADPDVADDCQQAVKLLSKRTLSGKQSASDPAFNLAAQLLAADLNVQAGAGTCPAAVTAINAAQALLAAINFNGSTHNPMTPAQVSQANSLAGTLDNYNNNTLCSP